MNNTLQLRVDNKTKQAAAHIFESLGLDLSAGIKIYLRHVLRYKGMPFPLVTENGFTIEQEKKILAEIKDAKKLLCDGKLKMYNTWDAMKKDMVSE